MRKFFLITLIITLLFCSTAKASFYTEDFLCEPGSSPYICRADVITYIVYAMGIDMGITYESYGGTNEMCDFYHSHIKDDYKLYESSNLQFKYQGNKIGLAIFHLNLCYGYGNCPEHMYSVRFQPMKSTTVNETLAFMVRALMPPSQELYDLNYTENIAKEKGLIVETDSFFDDLETPITFDEFRLILSRFMSQKVSLGGCCETYVSSDLSYFTRYDDMDITYYQLLEEKYGKGYAERILDLRGYDWLESYIRVN